MDINKKKRIFYSVILSISLCMFGVIFTFHKPDGIIGLMTIIVSILTGIISIYQLCKLSKKFEDWFEVIMELLLWIP